MGPNGVSSVLRLRGALTAVVLLAAAGCQEVADEGRPTALVLSSDRATAAVAEPIDFRYEGQGRSLAGLIVEYGDGSADSVAAHGAQTASGTLTHAFPEAGGFEVTAALLDFAGDTARDTVAVVITATSQDH